MPCKAKGEKALAAHAASIRASKRVLDYEQELLHERATPRRPHAPPPSTIMLERKIKVARIAARVANRQYESLMQAYRKCRKP